MVTDELESVAAAAEVAVATDPDVVFVVEVKVVAVAMAVEGDVVVAVESWSASPHETPINTTPAKTVTIRRTRDVDPTNQCDHFPTDNGRAQGQIGKRSDVGSCSAISAAKAHNTAT